MTDRFRHSHLFENAQIRRLDEMAILRPERRHVGRSQVRLEVFDTLPTFNNRHRIDYHWRLTVDISRRVNRGHVRDTTIFGTNIGQDCLERSLKGHSLPRFSGDSSNDVDH